MAACNNKKKEVKYYKKKVWLSNCCETFNNKKSVSVQNYWNVKKVFEIVVCACNKQNRHKYYRFKKKMCVIAVKVWPQKYRDEKGYKKKKNKIYESQ